MSAAPKTLPPPSNAARTWVKALNLLSPTTLFRTKKQLQEAQPSKDATKPPIPVHVLDTLAQLVDYLEENHRREEGLYRRESSALEWVDLKKSCLSRGREDGTKLPDLATLSPHAVTKVIKEILGYEFEPLIPYTLSQTLLDRVAQRDEITTLNEIVEKLKLLNTSKRDFLKVFLIHLHHISTSIPCRMTAKQLATQVGVLLIRPVEDPRALSAKDLFEQRRRLARLMIENASALPYDSETELDLRQLPDTEAKPLPTVQITIERPVEAAAEEPSPPLTESVHYVQAMWDAHNHPQTDDSLKALLSPFGPIATLAINDSGSRAIVAFCTLEGAQAAAEADLPYVRVRRRKPRSQPMESLSSSVEGPVFTPTQSPVDDGTKCELSTVTPLPRPIEIPTTQANSDKLDTVVTIPEPLAEEGEDVLPSPQSPQSSQASPAESPHFLHKLERPPSILLVQKAMKTLGGRDEMKLEDFESLPTSPQQNMGGDDGGKTLSKIVEEPAVAESNETKPPETPDSVEQTEATRALHGPAVTQRRRSLKELLTVNTALNRATNPAAKENPHKTTQSAANKLFSPPSSTKIGFMADLKSMMSKRRTPRSGNEARDAGPATPVERTAQPQPKATSVASEPKAAVCHSKRTQTTATILPPKDRATDTSDLLPVENSSEAVPSSESSNDGSAPLELLTQHVVVLEQCLRDVKSELEKLAAALGATRRSDVDRAILQAHEHLVKSIDHVLQSPTAADASAEQIPTQGYVDAGEATREFVRFLETRSTTQVKILEAEVRAGQELLRLHRSQHQKEVAELETEIASLRVTCKETEKMCAELRSELRQCRNELTCQVATAASIQRDRRDVDEKLIICETKLRAKEQELLTLHLAHDEMQAVAATAQRRLDEYRGSNPVTRITGDLPPPIKQKKPTGVALFPHTTAFLDRHHKPVDNPRVDGAVNRAEPSRPEPGTYSNTAELTAMQTRLQQRIHAQIETTKASLKEMQQFDTKRLFEDDDEDQEYQDEPDLEQLEQQLASARAEMDAAMDESRQKLHELLEPKTVSHRSSHPLRGSFDPTGLVEGLLAKALSDDWDTEKEGGNGRQNEETAHEVLLTPRRWEAAELRSSQQSELYKKWLRDRTAETRRSIPTTTPSVSQNNTTLREAQESMQRFQQALASMTTTHSPRQ